MKITIIVVLLIFCFGLLVANSSARSRLKRLRQRQTRRDLWVETMLREKIPTYSIAQERGALRGLKVSVNSVVKKALMSMKSGTEIDRQHMLKMKTQTEKSESSATTDSDKDLLKKYFWNDADKKELAALLSESEDLIHFIDKNL